MKQMMEVNKRTMEKWILTVLATQSNDIFARNGWLWANAIEAGEIMLTNTRTVVEAGRFIGGTVINRWMKVHTINSNWRIINRCRAFL